MKRLMIGTAIATFLILVSSANAAPTTFTFGSSSNEVSYECSLNGSSYTTCVSPASYSLKSGSNTVLIREKIKVTEVIKPKASFTFSPSSPVVGESVSLNASSSICGSSTPCSYEWSDDGNATRPSKVLWPIGTGITLNYTFHEEGIKYIRLIVKNSIGEESTVEHNITVKNNVQKVELPKNSSLPVVSGKDIENETLSSTTGSWTNNPTSYSYQWQDCNAITESCINISGANNKTYTLNSMDVGNKARSVVTATNSGGSTAANSAQTVIIEKVVHEEEKKEEPPVEEEIHKVPGCTTVISSTSEINSDLTSGSVVCLTTGTYGSINITSSPSSNATLKAAPGDQVTVSGINIAASNITVSQLYSTGPINVGSSSPYPGFSHDVIEHNEVGPTSGFGISILSATSTPSSFITIRGNKIHDTSSTSEGDALRIDGWNNVTIAENDIYNIKECASNTCHTDTLQSYQGEVPTSNLKIEKNYTHDNVGAQGLPFLKDGDISNVTISDNLSLRNSDTNGQVTGIWVDENINGLKITNNTYQKTSGSIVQADGSASNPTVEINHNVFDNLNVREGSGPSYSMTENYDIFTGNDEYTFNLGPNSKLESNPEFINTSTDDYRLKSNPNGIGINWSPAEMHYGPTGE